MIRSRILACTLAATTGLAATSTAGTHYVDAASKSGADDGTSWVNAFRGSGGLRKALLAAVPGDAIWVAAGTYLPTRTSDRTRSFEVGNGIELYGGFTGGETRLDQRDPLAHETILSGDLGADDVLGRFDDNSQHVVRPGDCVLDGLTVTGGNADGTMDGGGIQATNVALVMRRCVVRGNRSQHAGGGMHLGAAGVFEECRFEDNTAGFQGGAAHFTDASDSYFRRCVFTRNTAAHGSAVSFLVTDHTGFEECLFYENTATIRGAVFVPDPYPSLVFVSNCTMWGNLLGGFDSQLQARVRISGSILEGIGYSPGADVQVSYSCTPTLVSGPGNIALDPQFVDAAAGDFRLKPTSPCIDASANTGTLYDLDRKERRQDVPSVPDSGQGPQPIADMGAYETPGGLYERMCFGDPWLSRHCPCANFGAAGRGCRNSTGGSTGGFLDVAGTPNPDTIVLTASGLLPAVTCVFLQGNVVNGSGIVFGDGIRCIAGSLKRLAIRTSSAGLVTYPSGGDLSITARSAALGDPIAPGSDRCYQTWYRDPDPNFCSAPPGSTTNVTSGVIVHW